MSQQTLAVRVQKEDRDYIYDLSGQLNIPVSKIIKDLCAGMRNGNLTYNGEYFGIKDTPAEITKNDLGVDLTELFRIAKNRRVTPQSILDNMLRPYR